MDLRAGRPSTLTTSNREGHPERTVTALLDAVWHFRAGAPPEDDVTAVALRYQPRSPHPSRFELGAAEMIPRSKVEIPDTKSARITMPDI